MTLDPKLEYGVKDIIRWSQIRAKNKPVCYQAKNTKAKIRCSTCKLERKIVNVFENGVSGNLYNS